jgi:transcriptional regulator GlxA family with amidase domain
VLRAFVSRLEQLLGDTKNFEERVRITDRFLLCHSRKARAFDRISGAASQILRASGNARIADLPRDAGLSVRQFERCFTQQIGVHPKPYARIVRFEAALDSKARSPTKSWTDVAHEFGYCDQMHRFTISRASLAGHRQRYLAKLRRCSESGLRQFDRGGIR